VGWEVGEIDNTRASVVSVDERGSEQVVENERPPSWGATKKE